MKKQKMVEEIGKEVEKGTRRLTRDGRKRRKGKLKAIEITINTIK